MRLLRAIFCGNQTYELDGSTHDMEWTMKTYQDTTRQFVEENPDFFGARVIFTVNRLKKYSLTYNVRLPVINYKNPFLFLLSK